MKVVATEIPGVVIIEPKVFEDARGFFLESFNAQRFHELGLPTNFVQDNHSRSSQGTLRGLHYQLQQPQGKLVRAVQGTLLDVAVDLRRHSPTFGRSVSVLLSAENRRQLYVPPGCAHGFCAVTACEMIYKCTDFYCPQHEYTLMWNDPELAIDWSVTEPLLSEKDRRGRLLADTPVYEIGCEPFAAAAPVGLA
jgi:dTDP-4-dehydrorhamnose 3,5-epimerase